jgi:hypothetical protein
MVRKALVVLAIFFAAAAAAPPLRPYETPYYVIHTDLPPEGAAEAVVRMTRLSEVLRRQTRELGFTGRIERRLPFYLYARREDYLATGAPPESAGAFLGDQLVASADDGRGNPAWHVVQHEAFHQFAAATQGAEFPGWLNEGLGEYFGEALFTGDGYVTGLVPAWRLERVKKSIADGKFRPLEALVARSQEEWNATRSLTDYDQAWSLVQFLTHAEGGKFRGALVRYVAALAAGRPPDVAWVLSFPDAKELEARWRADWERMPAGGTVDLEIDGAVATVTGFVARAAAKGRAAGSVELLVGAAREGKLEQPEGDWLPPGLLFRALGRVPKDATWALRRGADRGKVVLKLPGGSTVTGEYSVAGGRVRDVRVTR